MQFVFPAFLTALLALAIPIIIHLFYFRRFKKVYFTNVRFLKEVKEETSNRRRLRNLLVLAMRCLALSLLVLAFAQPFLPKSDSVKQGEKAVSIFIDNSFSMGALSEQSPLIELAKQRARDIVSAHGPADRFQIITNELEGRDQRLISKDDALTRIEEVRSGPATRQLSKVLTRQQQALATGTAENQKAYLITDFQQNISDLEAFKDSLLAVDLVPMRAVQESNLSIDSAWFESPVQVLNQPARLMVKISNRGSEAADEVRLSFWHDGQLKPVGALSLPASAQKVDTVNFNILHPGWHQARLGITDYPVQFDDDYYINFRVAERVEVLSINAATANPYLNRAFSGAGFFRLDNTDARALDYSQFNRYQLILLHDLTTISTGLSQELQQFVRNGGNVLVFPARQADLTSYNAFLQPFGAAPLGAFESTPRQGAQLNTEAFVFSDVYLNKSANLRLPGTQGNFKLPPNRGEYLISYRDGSAQLAAYALGEGDLFVYAAPLDEQVSDLVRNGEVFVPMLFRMAVAGLKSQHVAHTIGTDEVLEAPHTVSAAGEMVYRLQLLKNDKQPEGAEFIPEQRILGNRVLLTPGNAVRDAGWYGLFLRQDSILSQYAFNYDRRESELTFRSTEDLKAMNRPNWNVLDGSARTNFAQVVDEQNQGIVLWRWCLLFALLFLALEGLFLRLWKV
ncbi:MAG: BatA domain-containing protein [Saprospiraceae bacterium]